MKIARITMLTGLALASAAALAAADVNLALAADAGSGTLSVQLETAKEATGIQFDLEYDSTAANVEVAVGPAADGAGKVVQTASPEPNRLRVLVFGFNRNVIPNGVVATVRVVAKAGGSSSVPVKIAAAAATDGAGKPLEAAAR